ncbi:MAG: transglycosylase domain-containing protein [Candidatus Dormibacteraeota bacterium]|nr:transglycosylase domain-containing protein [Candidatus Dormibacteraeota bacterium]
MAKRLQQLKTSRGHRTRARIHAFWAPLGQRARRNGRLRIVAVVIAGGLLLAGMGDVYAERYLSGLPSVKGLDAATFTGDTFISDRGGTLLADVGNNGNHRQFLTLDKISPNLVKGTIDVEDKNFFRNPGFDVTGIARAAYDNFRHRQVVGGGSTITQQLAKQLLLTPEQTYSRKTKEIILAYELDQTYTKNQILELYLNNSYYGEQSYGVEAAARTYFQKDAKDLDLAQATLLAGIPQAPTDWDPVTHPDLAAGRQKQVLDAMVGVGDISPKDAAAAQAEKISIHPPVNTFLAPHFVNYVQSELRKLGFLPGQQQLYVTTTLDYGKQLIAERAVRDNLAANRWRDRNGQLHSAAVAIDPKTGNIIAYVGSDDYNSTAGEFDYIGVSPRNTGSSMKVFTYSAAINTRQVTSESLIVDGPSPYHVPGSNVPIYNYTHGTYGTLPLREAWDNSLNIPAVKTELAIGIPTVVQFMRTVGLYPLDINGDINGPLANYGAALTLGGFPVKVLDEAHGIATIANLGVYHDVESILTVKDAHGKLLYQSNPDASRRQAVDPGVCFVAAQILSDNFNRRQLFGLSSQLHWSDRTVAAKTGTSDNFKDDVSLAFTPDVATVFWIGDTLGNDHVMVGGSAAEQTILPALHRYISESLAGVPGDRWFSQPSNVVRGDPASQPHAWFLADQRSVPKLPGELPTASPTAQPSAVPPDPTVGPVEASPTPKPKPPIPPLP